MWWEGLGEGAVNAYQERLVTLPFIPSQQGRGICLYLMLLLIGDSCKKFLARLGLSIGLWT
jgi:hypothetical protein